MTEQLAFDLTTKGSRDRRNFAKVLAVISRHVGRENAIALVRVSEETQIPPRDVQAIVKFLVEERSKPIGTAVARPYGYYVIRTEGELRDNYNHFVRRGLSNLKHARAYRKGSIVGPIVGQLEIEIQEER